AGAVLPQQSVDLTGLDHQVDVVVGHQGSEHLGDATQFELHRSSASSVAWSGHRSGPARTGWAATSEWRLIALPVSASRGVRRLDHEVTGDDLLLVLRELVLQLLRDLALEVVELSQADATVLEGADVGLVGEGFGVGLPDRAVHGRAHVLEHRDEDDVAVLSGLVAVRVDPEQLGD